MDVYGWRVALARAPYSTSPFQLLGANMARILVVEDEPSILKLISQNLTLRGFDIEIATDGETGLTRAREGKYDLILLDLMLPVISGWEVLRELGKQGILDRVPVIVVTAAAREEDEKRARSLGARDYLVKPFYIKELLQCVSTALSSHNQAGRNKQEKPSRRSS